MKYTLKATIASLTAGVIIFGGFVLAKQTEEMIEVVYDNIKIIIDHNEYTAYNGTGDVIEPFIYNGTTYLPVRAVASAFDKDVEWDQENFTVKLGSREYDWLDQMGYANYQTSGSGNSMTQMKDGTKDRDSISYDRGLQFKMSDITQRKDGEYESYQEVEYLLNGSYKTFEGNVLYITGKGNNVLIKLYGDGNLIYTSPIIAKGMKTDDFKVDVSGCKILKIRAERTNLPLKCDVIAGIADARLSK